MYSLKKCMGLIQISQFHNNIERNNLIKLAQSIATDDTSSIDLYKKDPPKLHACNLALVFYKNSKQYAYFIPIHLFVRSIEPNRILV